MTSIRRIPFLTPRPALFAALGLVLGACGGEVATPGATPSTLHARGLLLSPGEDLVIGLQGGSSGYEVRADFTPAEARLEVCPVPSLGEGPAEGACIVDLAWGVRTPVSGRRVGALRFRAIDRSISIDLVIEYFEQGREVHVRFPRVPPAPSAPACEDNACNPIFVFSPVHAGTLETSVRFAGVEGGPGELAVLAGRILGRSQTATGLPYRMAGSADGPSPLETSARLSAGAEYAVAVRQPPGPAARGLRDVELTVRWP